MVVLTHPDGLGDVTEWPPEAYPDKQLVIADHVRIMAEHGAGAGPQQKPLNVAAPYHGCAINHPTSPFLYVVPVNVPAKFKHRWNLDTLIDVIAGKLPQPAQLLFFQALQRKELLRQIAANLTSRFAGIATGIGATPLPIADIIVLTPLQLLLIAVVGGLSCKPLSMDTAKDYLAASGVALGAGVGLRLVAQQLARLVPFAGLALSGSIAGAGTYALGKSAEAYFFGGEVVPPQQFQEQYRQASTGSADTTGTLKR